MKDCSIPRAGKSMNELTRTSICNVSGTIVFDKKSWNSLRRALFMSEDFNQMGMSVEQLMDVIRMNIIPTDEHSYQVSYTNKPKDHFIEVSVERITQIEGVENQVVANINIGHTVMSTGQGAFSLEASWINTTVYPPGGVDA